jgi:hypothetical protein
MPGTAWTSRKVAPSFLHKPCRPTHQLNARRRRIHCADNPPHIKIRVVRSLLGVSHRPHWNVNIMQDFGRH